MNIKDFKIEMDDVPDVPSHGLWVERFRPHKFEDFLR